MPNISVLMPVYNAQDTLQLSLKSTLAALPRDSELLLIDDGSTDRSLDVAEGIRHHDRRVRILSMERNGGIVAALNRGLQYADARYVARMDADDICLPWRFRYSLNRLKDASLDLVFTSTASFGRNGFRPALPLGISATALPLHLLMVNPVAHSTMLGKREVISEAGGYRAVPSEDYDLWLRLAARGKRLARLPLMSVLYRKHGNQITAQSSWRREAAKSVQTAAVHRSLCMSVLGQDLDVFFQLRSSSPSSVTPVFFERVEQAGLRLERYDRTVIERQVRIIKAQLARRSVSNLTKMEPPHGD